MTPVSPLTDVVERIVGLDAPAMAVARERLDRLAKPPGSLGRLEELVVWLAGVSGNPRARIDRPVVIVAAADHGVAAAHEVSAYPQEVTRQMVGNFLAGGAGISVVARSVGARVVVLDVGVASPFGPGAPITLGHGVAAELVPARIRSGTRDMTVGRALTQAETMAAIEAGKATARRCIDDGADLVGVGEMGIGNTTAASALVAALTGLPAAAVTGRGTGIDERAWRAKVATIERALEVNRPDPSDPLGVLATIGGLEIAALVGVIIEGAADRVPVVLDGFITGAAALVASCLSPEIAVRLLAGHRSPEPGHRVVLDRLGLRPLLELDLRLGEGSGAALAMLVIDAAVRLRDGMATFDAAGVAGPVASRRL